MTHDDDDSDPFRRAGELADRPGVLAILVELHTGTGSATLHQLRRVNPPTSSRNIVSAVRWLAAEGLLTQTGGAGSWDLDDPDSRYQLTEHGTRILDSLAALVAHLSRAKQRSSTHRRTGYGDP
jgi:DNA-binding HxlR family transcriptional regulator